MTHFIRGITKWTCLSLFNNRQNLCEVDVVECWKHFEYNMVNTKFSHQHYVGRPQNFMASIILFTTYLIMFEFISADPTNISILRRTNNLRNHGQLHFIEIVFVKRVQCSLPDHKLVYIKITKCPLLMS